MNWKGCPIFLARSEVGIYKRKQERKKRRKQETRTRPRKWSRKKGKFFPSLSWSRACFLSFFLFSWSLSWSSSCFLVFFINSHLSYINNPDPRRRNLRRREAGGESRRANQVGSGDSEIFFRPIWQRSSRLQSPWAICGVSLNFGRSIKLWIAIFYKSKYVNDGVGTMKTR